MGRKRTPNELAELHGRPGRRPLPVPPKTDAVPAAAPPPHLSGPAVAEWNRVLEATRSLGLVTKLDLALLAVWCSSWALFLEAEEALREQGAVVPGRDGGMGRSPWLMVRSKAVEQLARIGGEFGWSPAARVRLGTTAAPLRAEETPPSGARGRSGRALSLKEFLATNPDRPPH
ncbi:phage terminase small subunit P27 family [Muricoccus radiodurans]|uniref:phage terminase small subunit P27 family n=1 Tax=Muricoccus radiodurans TaxID=2231721 RepID=UPI003CF3A64F